MVDINSLTREQLIERRNLLMRKAELESKTNVPSKISSPEEKSPNLGKAVLESFPAYQVGRVANEVLAKPYMGVRRSFQDFINQNAPKELMNVTQKFPVNVPTGLPLTPSIPLGSYTPKEAVDTLAGELFDQGATFGLGKVVGAVPKVAKSIKGLNLSEKFLIGDKEKVKVLENVRSAIQSVPRKARSLFADDLIRLNNEKIMMGKNPSISIKPMIDDLIASGASEELKPSVERVINSVPEIQKMLKNPSLAENITLKESQDILNSIKSQLSNSKLSGVGNRPTDIPIYEDLINEITKSQLDVHPEFADTKKAFGSVMDNYKKIKGKITEGGLHKNILEKFGGPELNNKISEILSGNKSVLGQIRKYRRVNTGKKLVKTAIPATAATGLGLRLIRD